MLHAPEAHQGKYSPQTDDYKMRVAMLTIVMHLFLEVSSVEAPRYISGPCFPLLFSPSLIGTGHNRSRNTFTAPLTLHRLCK